MRRAEDPDQRVILGGIDWWQFETFLAIRGSMTLRNALTERGIEPDECYAVGAAKESPDLAVEVIWTHGGLDKLEVYRGLGVREVWIWTKEALKAYELRGNAYIEIPQSVVIPSLTPAFIREFLDCETQTEAVQKLRATLRKPQRS